MITTAELIAAQKRQMAEKAIAIGLDEERSPKISKALNALREYLTEYEEWMPRTKASEYMTKKGDIQKKTADNQIQRLVLARYVEIRGEYLKRNVHRGGIDNREIRLISWPTDD